MFLSIVGRVSANSSTLLNRGFKVRGWQYFSFVVVKIVAVIRHLVHGYLAELSGCLTGMILGLG